MADMSRDETQKEWEDHIMEEQQRLNEENLEYGNADDREEEYWGYGKHTVFVFISP